MTKTPTFKALGMALYWSLGAYFFLALGVTACNQDETPSSPKGECGGALGLLEWTAVKNGSSLVTGRQVITGKVSGKAVHLDFGHPKSGVELRDSRLHDLVFGDRVTFDGSTDSALPDPGVTLPAVFKGTLSLGGHLTAMDVPAEVDWLSEGHLKARGTFEVSLAELGLASELETLLSLVEATVGDTVKAHFDIEVKEPCP